MQGSHMRGAPGPRAATDQLPAVAARPHCRTASPGVNERRESVNTEQGVSRSKG